MSMSVDTVVEFMNMHKSYHCGKSVNYKIKQSTGKDRQFQKLQ